MKTTFKKFYKEYCSKWVTYMMKAGRRMKRLSHKRVRRWKIEEE